MSDEPMTEFWVVWNPEHGLPRVRHTTFDLARREAQRLAQLNPGERFYVLRAEGCAQKVDVEWIPLDTDTDLPFR